MTFVTPLFAVQGTAFQAGWQRMAHRMQRVPLMTRVRVTVTADSPQGAPLVVASGLAVDLDKPEWAQQLIAAVTIRANECARHLAADLSRAHFVPLARIVPQMPA